MKTIEKANIIKLNFPIDGYYYNVQILRSVDDGKSYWYCGCGKYCKTLDEANIYASKALNQ